MKAFNLNDKSVRELALGLGNQRDMTVRFGRSDPETLNRLSGLKLDVQCMQQAIAAFNKRFKPPAPTDTHNLFAEFEDSELGSRLREIGKAPTSLNLP